MPSTQERSMVERIETETIAVAPERTEAKKYLTLVTDSVVPDPMAAPPTTLMPIPASATTSQEILATSTTTKTLLLLTSSPKFDN